MSKFYTSPKLCFKRIGIFIILTILCSTYNVFAIEHTDLEQTFQHVTADEILFVNLDTDSVLYSRNSNEQHAIASLTKMVTALLLLESSEDLDTVIEIPQHLEAEFDRIRSDNGARLELKIGEQITLKDLLFCMLLPSTNDCASAIADYLSNGNQEAFIELMNNRVNELGCTNTHFSCPHGLYDKDNYSTADDLSIIAKACLANERFMDTVSTVSFWLPKTNMHTEILSQDAPEGYYLKLGSTILLQNPESPVYRSYAKGIKTGFTDAAGRCLVTYAEDETGRYLLILLGVPNKKTEAGYQIYFDYATAILDQTYNTYYVGTASCNEEQLPMIPIKWCAKAPEVKLTAPGCTETQLLLKNKTFSYEYTFFSKELCAPVVEGTEIGTVTIQQENKILGSFPILVNGDYPFSRTLYFKQMIVEHSDTIFRVGIILIVVFLLLLFLRIFFTRRKYRVVKRYRKKYK